MKVLLTCTSIDDSHRTEDAPDSHYPLGLAYLHAYLEKYSDHEVETHFLNNVNVEICITKIKKAIEAFQPSVVGISIMTHSRISAFKLIEYIESNYPHIKIILGGIHPTIMWKQMAEKYSNTIIVIGEGEITFNRLLDRLEEGKPYDDIEGMAYFDGDKVVKTEERDLIDDLDILAFPKHEIFLFEGKTVANLLTSRGCPFKCNFCVLDNVSLRTVRFRSAENICDEIEHILEVCPTTEIIWLHDDAFMINKKRTMALCDEIIRRNIKTTFTCSARFRPISRELVQRMEQAGFNHVLFGLESGADAVMEGMKKGITKDHIRYGTSLFKESNIKMTAFLIVGLPGETEQTLEETIDFVQEMQYNNYLFYDDIGICSIYPGAEVYTLAKDKKLEIPGYGILDDNYWLTDGDVPFYEIDHTYEQLSKWKEVIRESISLPIITAPGAFLKQKKMLLSIIKYGFKFNVPFIIGRVHTTLNNNNLYFEILKEYFNDNISNNLMFKIASMLEKDLLQEYLKTISIEEAKNFITCFNQQTQRDKIIVARWQSQHIPATDDYISPKDKIKKVLPIIQ